MNKDDEHSRFPTTDEEAKAFIKIPPGGTDAPHDMYDILREKFGYSIEDALLRVLNTQCRQPEKNAEFIEKYGH